MKAIVQDAYGDTDKLRLAEIEPPEPGEGEVQVRVVASGLGPDVWHLMTGKPYFARLDIGMTKPKVRVRGNDFAGRVEKVGAGVTRFAPGDEVFGFAAEHGALAEFTCAPEKKVAHKPATVSFQQAATLPVSGHTAIDSLKKVGKLERGQSVLVIGAGGGVGSFAVQIAKAMGATVTGLASGKKLEYVQGLGADEAVDYTTTDLFDGSRSFDLIVDTAGRRHLRTLRRALASKGTLAIVGGDGGRGLFGGFDRQLIRAPILSLFIGQNLRPVISGETAEVLEELAALVAEGKLAPPVGRLYPLAEAPQAIDELARGHNTGKTVIQVSETA